MNAKTNQLKIAKEKNTNSCGIVTCIHCVGNKCDLAKCDFYERVYCQED